VHAVRAEVDGAVRAQEVMDADAALRGEVPDAGIGVGAVVLFVVRRPTEGRVLVIGPEHTAGGLSPEGEALGADDVPAEDDGGDGRAGVGAADGVEPGALLGSANRVGAEGTLEFGRVGLPEGEDLDGILEVAAEGTAAECGGEDLAGVNASHDELEAVAILGEAGAALDDCAELEVVKAGEVVVERVGVVADYGLGGGDAGGGEQESDRTDGGRSDAGHALGHEWLRDTCRRKAAGERRPLKVSDRVD
jgi:hypothetical protein